MDASTVRANRQNGYQTTQSHLSLSHKGLNVVCRKAQSRSLRIRSGTEKALGMRYVAKEDFRQAVDNDNATRQTNQICVGPGQIRDMSWMENRVSRKMEDELNTKKMNIYKEYDTTSF